MNPELPPTQWECVGLAALPALGFPWRPLAAKRKLRSTVVWFLLLSLPNAAPVSGCCHLAWGHLVSLDFHFLYEMKGLPKLVFLKLNVAQSASFLFLLTPKMLQMETWSYFVQGVCSLCQAWLTLGVHHSDWSVSHWMGCVQWTCSCMLQQVHIAMMALGVVD